MSKRLDRVLGFGTQHRYASPMLAKLGQEFLRTVRAAGIFAAWRRVPITTVTITLVIGFWLYDYVSVSSAATASVPRPSIAADDVTPIATIQPTPESKATIAGSEAGKKTRRTHRGRSAHSTSAHPTFRRKRVGHDEVDYVAKDVTIRLFAPGSRVSTARQVARPNTQRHIGKDVTVRYFGSKSPQGTKAAGPSGVMQAAERSALVSK